MRSCVDLGAEKTGLMLDYESETHRLTFELLVVTACELCFKSAFNGKKIGECPNILAAPRSLEI